MTAKMIANEIRTHTRINWIRTLASRSHKSLNAGWLLRHRSTAFLRSR